MSIDGILLPLPTLLRQILIRGWDARSCSSKSNRLLLVLTRKQPYARKYSDVFILELTADCEVAAFREIKEIASASSSHVSEPSEHLLHNQRGDLIMLICEEPSRVAYRTGKDTIPTLKREQFGQPGGLETFSLKIKGRELQLAFAGDYICAAPKS